MEPFLFPAGADEETKLQHFDDWKKRLEELGI
jgi:NAD(P)H dehydrogenase (quinone)